MRSLVFLPPPTLSHFPSAAPNSSSHATLTFQLSGTTRTTAVAEDRPSNQSREKTIAHPADAVDEVPDSVDPHLPAPPLPGEGEEESIAVSEVADAPVQVPWEVLHGVEADGALQAQQTGERRAAKRVRIRTSPVLVIETPERRPSCRRPRREVHKGGVEMDVDKSRVVLGEESSSDDESIEDESVAPTVAEGEALEAEQHEEATSFDDADKSRINLGDSDGSDSDVNQSMDSIAVKFAQEVTPAVAEPQSQGTAPSQSASHHANSQIGHAESHSRRLDVSVPQASISGHGDSGADLTTDRSLLALYHLPALAPAADRTTSAYEGEEASASSLQIRAPIPATTCRFTFFSKRPSRTNTSTAYTPADVPSVILHPPAPASLSVGSPVACQDRSSDVDPARPPSPKGQLVAPTEDQEPSCIRRTLPPMNDRNASLCTFLGADDSDASSMGGMQSIVPPPTLHFSLAGITPVARIIAHPLHFLSAPRPRWGAETLGAASSRVNLLVVVKEVGDVTRVRSKVAVDPPPVARPTEGTGAKAAGMAGRPMLMASSARAETRRGWSRAFTEALADEQERRPAPHFPTMSDGKTERVELVVMDGHMSSIRRLRQVSGSTSSGSEWEVVDEAAEKHLFKVVLWGQLAREWTSEAVEKSTAGGQEHDATEESLYPTRAGADTTKPTALRPGDVISLTNLNLSRHMPPSTTTTSIADSSSSASTLKRSRLGTGFPRLAPPGPGMVDKVTLVAHASAANASHIELCYRTDVHDRMLDAARNFDPAVAAFDLRSRRVLELSRLYTSSL